MQAFRIQAKSELWSVRLPWRPLVMLAVGTLIVVVGVPRTSLLSSVGVFLTSTSLAGVELSVESWKTSSSLTIVAASEPF